MTTLNKNVFKVVIIMAAWLPIIACSETALPPIQGEVLDKATKKPLPGAIVIGRWNKNFTSIGHSSTACVHVETSITDEKGHYQFPAWEGKVPTGIDAFKTDYEVYWPTAYSATEDYKKNIYYLEPFTGTREERLEYLKRVSGAIGCSSPGKSEKNLLPLRRALLEEVNQVADQKSKTDVIEPFLFQVEMIELGYEVAERRQIERLRGKK